MRRAGWIGQADERDDGEHIPGRHHSGEPASLRVGQRPSPDELWQKRRDNRVSEHTEDFGATYRGNDCRRRSETCRLAEVTVYQFRSMLVDRGGSPCSTIMESISLVIGTTQEAEPRAIPAMRYSVNLRTGGMSA